MSTSTFTHTAESALSSVAEILTELRAGRMVILVDEEDRENEGDLVLAADFVSAESINFMSKFGRGLICLTLTEAHCQRLQLPLMVPNNGSKHGTNFTLSIEAALGVSTGISAADRAHTIRVASQPDANPRDIVQPGHVFPLMSVTGGVLARAGHTEAGCDLTRLAGLTPAAVICEILKDDGTMARLPDLVSFAQEHRLKIGSIADLIQYRSATESLVKRVNQHRLNTLYGELLCVAYQDLAQGAVHLALVHGDIHSDQEVLVRVHEPLSILDLLETKLTTHSWTISRALEKITQAKSGVMVLLNCNPSAERFFSQFANLNALEQGNSLVSMHNKMDLRTYGIGAQILKELGVGRMRLLAKPRKMPSMAGFDLSVTGYDEE